MAERWVINASPIIVLAKIGQANLLPNLTDKIVVPRAVAEEISAGPNDDPALAWLSEQKNLITEPAPLPAELLAWDLGAGETAVLAYALTNPDWVAILDDNAARKCARSFSISVKGTLAVVLLAKQKGLIPSAADLIHQLKAHNFRIHDVIVREALVKTVGEDW